MAYSLSEIICKILQTRDVLQIYHWNTKSYARHKASDDLVQGLTSHMDKFVEVYMGINKNENITVNKKITLKSYDDTQISNCLIDLLNYLEDLTLESRDRTYLRKSKTRVTSDLLNIRDDMMNEIHKTLYLFTLH
jgi:DNA-binding ferritin-like protein